MMMVNKKSVATERAFKRFIQSQNYPCVGAKSALAKGNIQIMTANKLAHSADDLAIYEHLVRQAAEYSRSGRIFQSLVILFNDDKWRSEKDFESVLWKRLQALSDIDKNQGYEHDQRVSSDPSDPNFAVSFAGTAFFVLGLHPNASRPARRFDYPAIIFNIHDQFEQMRSTGLYEQLQETISERDIALAGNRNPMLALHGSVSAARQYSGRAVESDWACPYQRNKEMISDDI
ncbi:guanitoxin biosynthesis heme-dependent pre-guanitoxin N-hydroxylase GntA [Parasphingorhabdus sp.]|uniref:guanitoxin biosynthesis heme-dependent pre-guanitoxin N-hydroxylase GntA n=1 Tax=Parasphingorhabdus sp. TaxID=2709688 RepID=UPI003C72ECA0